MHYILFFITSTFVAFALNLLFTPLIIFIAHRNSWYDTNDHRKIHTGDIPRVGGIGIFLSFFLSVLLTPYLLSHFVPLLHIDAFFSLKYLSVIISFGLIFLVGLIDDFTNVKALFKLVCQLIPAIVLSVLSDFNIKTFNVPFFWFDVPLGVLAYPLTILWIIGITNAVNLVDGMDGLAGGIAAIAACALGFIAIIQKDLMAGMLYFIIFGAVGSFLIFNFPKAKIFMGDSGALFLGFIFGVLPLFNTFYGKSSSLLLIAPITVLAIPILDTFSAITRRIIKHKPIYHPDREHLHHKLLDFGFSPRKILLIIYSFCALFAGTAMCWVLIPKQISVWIVVGVYSLALGFFIMFLVFNIIRIQKINGKK